MSEWRAKEADIRAALAAPVELAPAPPGLARWEWLKACGMPDAAEAEEAAERNRHREAMLDRSGMVAA